MVLDSGQGPVSRERTEDVSGAHLMAIMVSPRLIPEVSLWGASGHHDGSFCWRKVTSAWANVA